MAGKYDAYIIEAEGKFLVRPAVAPVEGGSGKHFQIRNLTDFDAAVTLAAAVNGATKTAGAGGGAAKFTINSKADGSFPYEVWLDLGNGIKLRVSGESDPVIIIDP
jgi:hypothetical protein